jgi:hypothetical protein
MLGARRQGEVSSASSKSIAWRKADYSSTTSHLATAVLYKSETLGPCIRIFNREPAWSYWSSVIGIKTIHRWQSDAKG